MRIAGIQPVSLVNGEGVRFVVFLQGCAHRCPGCQNPDTWDFNGGHFYTAEEIANRYMRHAHLLDGITLSGGDPFYQQEACVELLRLLPDVNVWIYTGFEYDEIKNAELAKRADVLVTGPYIEKLRCEGRMYGSSNQEIHRKEE
jgi:anaerobic ribonucleoside-triphosphate reductase activating protein